MNSNLSISIYLKTDQPFWSLFQICATVVAPKRTGMFRMTNPRPPQTTGDKGTKGPQIWSKSFFWEPLELENQPLHRYVYQDMQIRLFGFSIQVPDQP